MWQDAPGRLGALSMLTNKHDSTTRTDVTSPEPGQTRHRRQQKFNDNSSRRHEADASPEPSLSLGGDMAPNRSSSPDGSSDMALGADDVVTQVTTVHFGGDHHLGWGGAPRQRSAASPPSPVAPLPHMSSGVAAVAAAAAARGATPAPGGDDVLHGGHPAVGSVVHA